MVRFERRLGRRNLAPFLGEGSEGAVEAPSDFIQYGSMRQMGPMK